ncbi:hypothetical protein H2201_008850 [Coniosporium apollinis]|uniref:Uncharacterized protein n=1 Tax=Coniosporium apollinis TaxID=61459 RepID=A0ABQ9NH37_9PEZI|nr:hypothetical protein H2201_008850 [Coniosporium apollinis]
MHGPTPYDVRDEQAPAEPFYTSTFQSALQRGMAVAREAADAAADYPSIARTKTDKHTAPITIEVEHMSRPEVNEHIEELAWYYRRPYLPGVKDETTNAKNYKRYQQESERAWSSLERVFNHRREFNEGFVTDMSEGAFERITDRMTQWTENLDWSDGEGADNCV